MSSSIPQADFEILFARISACMPNLAGSSFRVLNNGFDSVAVIVDERLVFKFPRHAAAEARLRREADLLQLVHGHSPLPVPDICLFDADPVFSHHQMLNGNQLLPEQYATFSEPIRDRLAKDVARFFVCLHSIPVAAARAAGAVKVASFAPINSVADIVDCLAPADGRSEALCILADYKSLSNDFVVEVFGHFDCHGWNMAFDSDKQILAGIFDFGDSGIGDAHREFVYPGLLSPEHALRVADHYERLGGMAIDRSRLALLIGYHRLMEMADYQKNPEMFNFAMTNWNIWRSFAINVGYL